MNAPGERRLRVGDGVLDALSGELSLHGRRIRLSPRTAALLAYLVQHGDRAVTKEELGHRLWPGAAVTDESLLQSVKEIRHALGRRGHRWLRAVPPHGYAFVGNAPRDSPHAAASFWTLLAARWREIAVSAVVTLVVAGGFAAREWIAHHAATSAARPLSVVVLPFANRTGDARRDADADDMTEAMADALARGAMLAVVAPSTVQSLKGARPDPRSVAKTLGVRYVIEGTLRATDAGPQLMVRLSEAGTAQVLWNEEYLRPTIRELGDLARTRVPGTFGFQIARIEARRARSHPAPSPQALELFNEARAIYETSPKSRADVAKARALLEEAVQRDEDLIGAWRLLATTMLENVRFSATRDADLRRAEEAIAQAVARAPDASHVRMVEGMVLSEQHRVREALVAYRLAVALDPQNVAALGWEADALTMLGRPREAFEPLQRALAVNAKHPFAKFIYLFIGIAHVQLGEDADAVEHLTMAAEAAPQHPWPHIYLAAAFGNLGRRAEAAREAERVRALLPGFTVSGFRERELSDDPDFLKQRTHFYQGLRRAGLPE